MTARVGTRVGAHSYVSVGPLAFMLIAPFIAMYALVKFSGVAAVALFHGTVATVRYLAPLALLLAAAIVAAVHSVRFQRFVRRFLGVFAR